MNEQNGSRNYNGWTNYETWAVSLWLDNEEGSYRYWSEEARGLCGEDRAVYRLADQLKEEVTEAAPDLGCTLYADLLGSALDEVDWREIAEGMMDAAREGWQPDVDSCDGSPTPSMEPQVEPDEQPAGDKPIRDENPFGEVIFAYTRAQAIEDGVLVDVTETAKEVGFRFPVALTRPVYERYVVVPEGVEAQDERGRLWDIVYMTGLAIRGAEGRNEIPVSLHVRNSNRRGTPPLVTLKALCGPGDHGEPVITIMLPEED